MSDPIQFDPPEPSELSELLEGYEVTSLIATGGMGAVYKATQLSLDRSVAIKLLPEELGDLLFRDQFQAEARAMAKLNHVNLIGIYDFGEANGRPYIVMEFVAGKSLYYSSYGKAIDQTTTAELVIGICRGLSHAHDSGIIHRDIKPANILLDPNATPKIGDFGLASPADSESDEETPIFGTPGYAAPEVFASAKGAGVQSDIYAVGVVLYELLTGKMPVEPASPPSLMSKVDPRLDPIFKKATRRNPALRYQDAEEMAKDLEKILSSLGTGGRRAIKTGSDRPKTQAATLKRRLATESDSTGKDSSKPKLVPLKEGESAPKSRLTPLPERNPGEEEDVAATLPVIAMSTGSNWPIIRNLIIIALLIPTIIFTWGLYEKKQKRLKDEGDAKELEEKNKKIEGEAQLEKEYRDAAERGRLAAEEKAREKEREKKRLEILAFEESRTPMERLEEFREGLSGGSRDRFPDGTIDRSSHFLFFVESPMTWTEACEFAEIHGGHLATPITQTDIDVLSKRMGIDMRRVWIGGGASGRNSWAWVTGEEWTMRDPGITLGYCAALTNTGVIKARSNAEKNAFVIQWSKDGSNIGSLAAQLERLVPTLGTPSPAWPPATVSQENRNFLLVQNAVSWDEADLIASSAEGHLAVVSTPLEGFFVRDYLQSSLLSDQSVWLGGRRTKDDTWTWITGEAWAKASWAPNSPDGGSSDSALRYLQSADVVGWDDANPKKGKATGFLIEWSNDSDQAPPPTKANPGAATGQFAKLRGVGRRLVTKEVDDYSKALVGNKEDFMSRVSTWFRFLSKNKKNTYEAAYFALEENSPKDGDLSGEINLGNLPADMQGELAKARGKQTRKSKDHNTKLEFLRQNYLEKLLTLKDEFEKGRLKTQIVAIDSEIEAIGQNAESFRAHFVN